MLPRHPRGMAAATVLALAAVTVVLRPGPAAAACHRFDVAVEPASVAEGAMVTVTVTRDAGVNPSSIDVSTVNETATDPQDFPAVQRTVSMTTETEQSFTVPITNDTVPEGPETFRLHLSNPGGCAVNPNFQVGPDARVTIQPSDPLPATTAPTPATTAVRPGATTTTPPATTSTTVPSSTTSVTAPSTTTEATIALAQEDDDDGGSAAAVALLGAAAAAAGAIAYLIYRRRRFV